MVSATRIALVKPNVHADTRLVPAPAAGARPCAAGKDPDLNINCSGLDAHAPFSNDMQSAAFIIAPEIEAVYKNPAGRRTTGPVRS